jgi:hypothetical protein
MVVAWDGIRHHPNFDQAAGGAARQYSVGVLVVEQDGSDDQNRGVQPPVDGCLSMMPNQTSTMSSHDPEADEISSQRGGGRDSKKPLVEVGPSS